MPFNIYNSVGLTSNNLNTPESPAMSSRFFDLVERTRTSEKIKTNEHIDGMFDIHGIATEPPQLSYSTSWTIGPTGSLANKVNDLFKNDIFKLMASANREYKPILLTDGWTQQYPKEGAKLATTIQFRSYPYDMYNTTNYFKVFKMLFYSAAPMKYGFDKNIELLGQSLDTAERKGLDIGRTLNSLSDAYIDIRKSAGGINISWQDVDAELKIIDESNNKIGMIETFQSDIAKVSDIKTKLAKSAAMLITIAETFTGTNETACPRFTMEYGNIFKAGLYSHWVISGWSCKPSVNTTIMEDGKICPIFVDFTINVQTAGKIGTTDLSMLLNSTAGNVVDTEKK